MQTAPAGDNAQLITLPEDITAAELHAAARAMRGREGVVAVVPGHSSLYVVGVVWASGLPLVPPPEGRPEAHTTT